MRDRQRRMLQRSWHLPNGGALSVLALLGAVAVPGAAFAIDTCRGELSASALRPLPVPAVVGIDTTDSSAENQSLANAFTRGMSNAGVKVPGPATATVNMRVSWQVLSPGGNNPQDAGGNPLVPLQPGPQGTGSAVWSGNSQTFAPGGIDRTLPQMPNSGVFTGNQAVQPGLLVFRAEARDPTTNIVYWIGSIQCTLLGSENEQLLFQLGQIIGGAIGQRRDHVAM